MPHALPFLCVPQIKYGLGCEGVGIIAVSNVAYNDNSWHSVRFNLRVSTAAWSVGLLWTVQCLFLSVWSVSFMTDLRICRGQNLQVFGPPHHSDGSRPAEAKRWAAHCSFCARGSLYG